MNYLTLLPIVIPALIGVMLVIWILKLRRIVPTNVVHIVQQGTRTISYGVGKTSNVYYEWPSWMPKIGVTVRELPVSNFDIDLQDYSAYDKDRVPFVVDVKAFFHIADTNAAAEKVESFEELKGQLKNVVQGAVRSILAKSPLEEIMEERSIFGTKFTDMVNADLKNWGVESIKNIELMDVRDASGSEVIHQIMAKRMSAIDMESRTEVAKNERAAKEAELEAEQKVKVKQAQTDQIAGEEKAKSDQAIGIAQAEAKKRSGIADQSALADIAEAAKHTADKDMEVIKVKQVRQAQIDKEQEIIDAEKQKATVEISAEARKIQTQKEAEAEKIRKVTIAQGELEARKNDAEGIRAVGTSEADIIQAKGSAEAAALEKEQLASVTAQTTLAKEIGENQDYQDYLIRVKTVDKDEKVEIAKAQAMAEALGKADLKILANSGDVHSGMNSLSDILSAKGGSQINGLMESLKQTEEGQGLLSLLSNLGGTTETDK